MKRKHVFSCACALLVSGLLGRADPAEVTRAERSSSLRAEPVKGAEAGAEAFSGHKLQRALPDPFEEKKVKKLAMHLGAAMLAVNETNLVEALDPAKCSPELLDSLARSGDLKKLAQVNRAVDRIDCIGFNMISTEVITFVYVFTSQTGPYGIKCNVYLYKQNFYVSGFSVTSTWDGLEKMAQTVTPLETKLEIRKSSTR